MCVVLQMESESAQLELGGWIGWVKWGVSSSEWEHERDNTVPATLVVGLRGRAASLVWRFWPVGVMRRVRSYHRNRKCTWYKMTTDYWNHRWRGGFGGSPAGSRRYIWFLVDRNRRLVYSRSWRTPGNTPMAGATNGIPPSWDRGERITGESLGVGVLFALGRPGITGGIAPLYGRGNMGEGGHIHARWRCEKTWNTESTVGQEGLGP
jgi:hypothetical protein